VKTTPTICIVGLLASYTAHTAAACLLAVLIPMKSIVSASTVPPVPATCLPAASGSPCAD
jgi:hypothetical protein